MHSVYFRVDVSIDQHITSILKNHRFCLQIVQFSRLNADQQSDLDAIDRNLRRGGGALSVAPPERLNGSYRSQSQLSSRYTRHVSGNSSELIEGL